MAADLSVYDNDHTLYLVTSLTAGSSHIITATSRMETILRANKISFVGVDTATDDRMRSLWQRRARGRKFPGLVREGFFLGDIEQIEEWNEFGELHENLAPSFTPEPVGVKKPGPPSEPPVSIPTNAKQKIDTEAAKPAQPLVMRQLGEEAAAKSKAMKSTPSMNVTKAPTTPAPKSTAKVDENTIPATVAPSSATKATALPSAIKVGESDIGGLKSPKSIPLPETLGPKSPSPAMTSQTSLGTADSSTAKAGTPTKTHRGSSVSAASVEEIKEIEKKNAIKEEAEEEDDEDEEEEEEEESSEEEDEDDDDDEEEDDEDEDEKPSSATAGGSVAAKAGTTTAPTATTSKAAASKVPAEPSAVKSAAAKTSCEPAKDATKAGESVGD